MSVAAQPLADMALALAALIGLWALDRVLRAAGADDPLIRRFRFGLLAVMLVYAGRALSGSLSMVGFRAVEYLGAALIPLAVLLLTEGLLRRHASVWAKAMVATGMGFGVLLAFFPSALVDPGRILFLLALQVSTFAYAGWLVLSRDKAGLSASENRAAERLALSLVLILPLGALDFLIVVFNLPLRPSGLAVLVLCWLAIGLQRGEASHRAPILTLGLMLACALGATLVLTGWSGAGREGAILTGICVLAAILLAAVLTDAQSALREVETPSILAQLAAFEGRDPVALMRSLAGHPAVAGALFVTPANLAELDDGTLGRLFAARPVLRRRDTPLPEPDLADLCGHLFERFEASHILQVRAAPRLLLALSLPTIATGSRIEDELDLAQRMAARMEPFADAD